jgi:hypothetical protein
MESDKDFKEVCCAVAYRALWPAMWVKQFVASRDTAASQVMEQSIEPSLSSESVVIAGGGTFPARLNSHAAATRDTRGSCTTGVLLKPVFCFLINSHAGIDPRNEPSPSPDRPNFSNFQLG